MRPGAEPDRRRDTPSSRRHLIAVGYPGIGPHRVEANRGAGNRRAGDRLVDIDGGPLIAGVAGTDCDVSDRAQIRSLAHLVDRAAGRAASSEGGRWPFGNLDLLEIERVSRVSTEVANA